MNSFTYDKFVDAMMGADMDTKICGLGIAGEAGEVADIIKKEYGHGHPRNVDKMRKELGDVLWYVTAIAHKYGLTLDDVMRGNIDKLTKRFPEGKFTTEASAARVDQEDGNE
jgi:NTP pyrophosphatase (non-canonical NTP hydrolase)